MKHKRLAVGLAMMALGAAAKADTITSVSCSTPTAAFQTDTAACDAIGRYGYSQASVTTGVVLPASASDTAVINVNSSAAALQYSLHGIGGTATAQSAADVGIVFDTTGAIDTEITLQAFESDQTTGVQLFDPPGSPAGLLETPEPQGLGMLAGLASLGILFFIRQRRTPKNTFTR